MHERYGTHFVCVLPHITQMFTTTFATISRFTKYRFIQYGLVPELYCRCQRDVYNSAILLFFLHCKLAPYYSIEHKLDMRRCRSVAYHGFDR